VKKKTNYYPERTLLITLLLSLVFSGFCYSNISYAADFNQQVNSIRQAIARENPPLDSDELNTIIQQCESLLAEEPKSLEVLCLTSICYALKDDIDTALVFTTRALEISPDYPDALAFHGFLLYGKSRQEPAYLSETVDTLKKLLTVAPDYRGPVIQGYSSDITEYMYHLGRAYTEMEDKDSAREVFQQILQKYPDGRWAPMAELSLKRLALPEHNDDVNE